MRPARILVVDDEPGMLRAVERVLGQEYEVAGTQRSRDALTLADAFAPDLAIVDVRMPDVDGFELTTQLKARFAGLDVILMTGSADDHDEKLVRAIGSRAFYFIQKPFDREVLRTLVERCVELRWRREQNRHHLNRLEAELAQARAFQQSLLPDKEATVNGTVVCCHYTPSSSLGGDLYDYAPAADGSTALLIADVSGHGVSAAMLTGVVKSAFYASHVDDFDPLAVVQRVSAGLSAFSANRFVTLFAGRLCPDEHRMEYVNAGHPPPVVWGARAPLWLGSTGPLVSPALTNARWEAAEVPVDEGDQVLLYTDGVWELLADDEGYAEARLLQIVDRTSEGGGKLLDAILAEVQAELAGRPQPDDVTMMTARVVGGGRAG